MLVLGRNQGEGIWIGNKIRIVIVRISTNGKVSLGIEAPPEVIVLREELLEKTPDNKKEAA